MKCPIPVAAVVALLLTTGCSAFPSDAFRSLPWQGDIQGVLMDRYCADASCSDMVAVVLDIVAGRTSTGHQERMILVESAELRRRLSAVPIGNHLEIHLEVPDGHAVMADFEDHADPPASWSQAIAQGSKAYRRADP